MSPRLTPELSCAERTASNMNLGKEHESEAIEASCSNELLCIALVIDGFYRFV